MAATMFTWLAFMEANTTVMKVITTPRLYPTTTEVTVIFISISEK